MYVCVYVCMYVCMYVYIYVCVIKQFISFTYPQSFTAIQCDTTRNGYITVVAKNYRHFILEKHIYILVLKYII